MVKKIYSNKHLLLDDHFDDENETVSWIDTPAKSYYNCGCCTACSCENNKACDNCGCNCNCDEDMEDDYDYESDDECEDCEDNLDNTDNESDNNISKLCTFKDITNFNINIIKDGINEKKVRISLEIKLKTNNKDEVISIDLDINRNTYLKIAEELFK